MLKQARFKKHKSTVAYDLRRKVLVQKSKIKMTVHNPNIFLRNMREYLLENVDMISADRMDDVRNHLADKCSLSTTLWLIDFENDHPDIYCSTSTGTSVRNSPENSAHVSPQNSNQGSDGSAQTSTEGSPTNSQQNSPIYASNNEATPMHEVTSPIAVQNVINPDVLEPEGTNRTEAWSIIEGFCRTLQKLISEDMKQNDSYQDLWLTQKYSICPFVARLFHVSYDIIRTWYANDQN